jgi:CYTH domain-containing protein
MGCEIERKFLVKGEFRHLAVSNYRITQRYLCIDGTKVIRIRISGDTALLTIKGAPAEGSFSRSEFEIPINIDDAEEIMKLALPGKIEKTRYLVPSGRHTFEVDVFHDKNEGLIVAEIELDSESEFFQRPSWLGGEVTGDPQYYNASLLK